MQQGKISVIIPVYNAEKSIFRCVESILFGQYRNVSIILVDDCSKDESWKRCRELADKYPNVTCVRNEKNSGVSYTRNRGLQLADSEYVLFVDSDDWVSGRYAGTMLSLAEEHPDKLPICGLHFINELDGLRQRFLWSENGSDVTIVEQARFFELLSRFQLQQIWNKVFRRDVIEAHRLRFDENQSMGEDFQFVLDYMEAAGIKQCIVLNQPLYYYVRANTTSLMSKFGLSNTEMEYTRLKKLLMLMGEETAETQKKYEDALTAAKRNHIYQICRAKDISREEKLALIRSISGESSAEKQFREQMLLLRKEKASETINSLRRLPKRAVGRLRRHRRDRIAEKAKKIWNHGEFSVISQNCIGGVLYHDLGLRFLSPTVNLYFTGPDFVKFAEDLEHHLKLSPEMRWDEEYPVGMLGDIEIRFMHYSSCTEAFDAWERRKNRIERNKILILSTDMEGFDESCYEIWKKLPYPKVLFTANSGFSSETGSVYFPEYEQYGRVPDLIPGREFYKDGVLIKTINELNK